LIIAAIVYVFIVFKWNLLDKDVEEVDFKEVDTRGRICKQISELKTHVNR